MAKFRKKPVVIEAVQYARHQMEALRIFCPTARWTQDGQVSIQTLEGSMIVSDEDWVIKGVDGEFYPCKPDIFEQTYEPVSLEA